MRGRLAILGLLAWGLMGQSTWPADRITLLDVSRAIDGELLTLRGESVSGLAYPGAGAGLPEVWRRVESAAAGILQGVTLTSLLADEAVRTPAGRGAS